MKSRPLWCRRHGEDPKALEFQAQDDFIALGRHALNLELVWSIRPKEFIELYNKIARDYDFRISPAFYQRFKEKRTVFGKKQSVHIDPLRTIVDFLIQCNTLLEHGIEIGLLLSEFSRAGDIYELRHSCSLSYLVSVYASSGYEVRLLAKSQQPSPDLSVNGIPADLKVIQATDWGARHANKGNEFTTQLSKDLCYDIGTAIRNRLHEAVVQSDLVFIDLSSKSMGSLYIDERFDSSDEILPQPQRYRVVFFCKVGPNRFLDRQGSFSFFGAAVDFDKNLWCFIREYNRAITHKMIEGRCTA